MPENPQNITISLTSTQIEKLHELKKITGDDTTSILRNALKLYYTHVIEDEDQKNLAKINALLDVQ